jgi:hypothetical protein
MKDSQGRYLQRWGKEIHMAVTVEAQLFTKQRVHQILSTISSTGRLNPVTKAFFMTMGQLKSLTQLATYIITNLTDDVVVENEACKVFAIWLKKQATATDAYFKLFDDATNSGTAGDERITLSLLVASEEAFLFYPQGADMAAGIVITSHTSSNGTTDSTSGDGPNGIIVYGAP